MSIFTSGCRGEYSKVGLENIYMSSVYRRRLSSDYPTGNPAAPDTILDEEEVDFTLGDPGIIPKDQDDRYYNMPGNYFMIPISEVKNINITYYQAMEG